MTGPSRALPSDVEIHFKMAVEMWRIWKGSPAQFGQDGTYF